MIGRWRRWGALVALAALPFAACSTTPALTCAVPAAEGCPSLDGVTTFCRWAAWGCASQPACGGYLAVVDQGASARLTYYYAAASGQFVATVEEAFGGGNPVCLAGPSRFTPPAGCAYDTLAECAPPPSDGGVSFLDASTDAPFNPPAPSGSPSTQPFAVPYAPR